jgi:hypothetical protein
MLECINKKKRKKELDKIGQGGVKHTPLFLWKSVTKSEVIKKAYSKIFKYAFCWSGVGKESIFLYSNSCFDINGSNESRKFLLELIL